MAGSSPAMTEVGQGRAGQGEAGGGGGRAAGRGGGQAGGRGVRPRQTRAGAAADRWGGLTPGPGRHHDPADPGREERTRMAEDITLIIRGGTVVDGSGGPPREADVAIAGNRIAAVGKLGPAPRGAEEMDAKGLVVTPGFVDIHTHYDAQATWSSRLDSASLNGVTTALIGNCGVGFAPCRPDRREALVKLMEGVEDLPEVV